MFLFYQKLLYQLLIIFLNSFHLLLEFLALEAAPIPLKKLKGTEITKAQGQDTTKK